MRTVLFLLIVCICRPAFAVPDKTLIEVKYYPDDIRYIHKNTKIACSQNKRGRIVLGCAREEKKMAMKINCAERHIQIDIFSKNREIEIHADLPKESCEYREVLDHELTHMDLHADVLENIVHEGMEDIVDAFNRHFKNGRNCQAAVAAAKRRFDGFSRKYQKEDRRINQEFDRDDEDSVLLNCKTPPKVKIVYAPPEIDYSSDARIECRHKKRLCLQDGETKTCEPLPVSSCTEMPVSFSFEIKPYLAQVRINVNVPEIKTRISDRYQPDSCEYRALQNFELSFVERVEDVVYDLIDTVRPEAEDVYKAALQKEYSGRDLIDAVSFVVKNRIDEANAKIAKIMRAFAPMTEKELENKCAR